MDVLPTLRSRILGPLLALGWLAIANSGNADIRKWFWLPVGGFALWLLILLIPSLSSDPPPPPSDPEQWPKWRRLAYVRNFGRAIWRALETVAVVVAVLAVWAIGKVSPPIPQVDPRFVVTFLLTVLAATFLVAMFVYVRKGQPIEVRSNWGGLGGAGGGWRISMPLVCLVAAIVLAGLAAIVNMPVTPSPAETKPADAKPAATDSTVKDTSAEKKSAATDKKGTQAAGSQATAPVPVQ